MTVPNDLPTPTSTAIAPHYVWGDGCDGWRLVHADALSVIQERMPAGTAETRHRHAAARQFFFVLDGELTIEVESVEHTLGTRQGLEVPPGVAHRPQNHSSADTHFLVVSQPPTHGDRQPA